MNKQIILVLLLISAILITGCATQKGETMNKNNITVIMSTSMGDIELSLDKEHAPITVENFLKYVDDGFYNETIFHRVIPDFMIQGGGFNTDNKKKATYPPIQIESDNNLTNLKGTIAMARTNVPDSATSQFFINTVNNDFLNYQSINNPGYAVFGKVVSGMDVVMAIEQVQTKSSPAPNWPVKPVIIKSITRK